tara:strand:+ start:11 stop:265 length:255 start_codon:yes stop_codon:yes gene_type:complete
MCAETTTFARVHAGCNDVCPCSCFRGEILTNQASDEANTSIGYFCTLAFSVIWASIRANGSANYGYNTTKTNVQASALVIWLNG